MRLHFFLLVLLPGFSLAQSLKLWYKQPACNWNEALPVGNGRLGVMIFGKVDEELLQLNESTLWSGGPVNRRRCMISRQKRVTTQLSSEQTAR